jgi:hypothetical protein
MMILGLDAATRTGFCLGEPDGPWRTGAVRLKKPDDPVQVAWCNAGFFLKDMFVLERPDLIALEAPMPPGAMPSGDAVMLQWGVVAVITFMAKLYEIRIEYLNAQKVSRHFTGKARWSAAEGGRKAKKEAAVQRARVLGYMEKDAKGDDDIADACACFDYAASLWGRKRTTELHLFGERA